MDTFANDDFRYSIAVFMVAVVTVSDTTHQIWCSSIVFRCIADTMDGLQRHTLFTIRFIVGDFPHYLVGGIAVHGLIARIVGFQDSRSHAPTNVYYNYRLSKKI